MTKKQIAIKQMMKSMGQVVTMMKTAQAKKKFQLVTQTQNNHQRGPCIIHLTKEIKII